MKLNGQYLVFEDSSINYADDISGWSASTWPARTGNGISMGGTHLTIRKNTITNVDHGIGGGATDSLVSGAIASSILGVMASVGWGTRMVYEYNTIKNAYEVDGNHDDGFQSWSIGGGVGTGVVRDVVLWGNTIINFENPDQPMKSSLQGIGLFDGM